MSFLTSLERFKQKEDDAANADGFNSSTYRRFDELQLMLISFTYRCCIKHISANHNQALTHADRKVVVIRF